jgi:solute carrier family 25 folate transporter 32
MAYESLKNHWALSRAGGKEGLTNWDVFLLSATSKMFAGSITYPYQVVRARLQTYDAQTKYKGVVDVVKQVAKYEGWSGFYKGYVEPFDGSGLALADIRAITDWDQTSYGFCHRPA